MITLNEGQQQAHDQLAAYLLGKDRSKRMWLLKGYAGTGKSTTIGKVIETVLRENFMLNIAVSAPTHKAVNVLKRMQSLGTNVSYATIHSLLGLKEHINPVTGKQEFKQAFGEDGPRIEGFDAVILDETSMLSNELFELLDPYVSQGIKLVMMGDPVQIPPVNESDPVPFILPEQEKYDIGTLELTEIVRQAADNPILKYATALRQVYKTGNAVPVSEVHNGHGIEVLNSNDGERVKNLLQELFDNEQFQQDADHAKVIAWTNRIVDHYNKHIRMLIYHQDNPPKLMKGEKLVADSPVIDTLKDTILLHTNQEVEVLEFTESVKMLVFHTPAFGNPMESKEKVVLKCYRCKVSYDTMYEGKLLKAHTTIDILHEDDEAKFEKFMEQHKQVAIKAMPQYKSALWRKYYANLKEFAWMKYNYAITAHKSQGSTYNNVLMLNWDMDKNKRLEERNRIKYVSATRPRHKLYIVN